MHEYLNVKHMNVFSLSVIFFSEAALKRRPGVTEAEMKLLTVSAQPKTHLAVHGGGLQWGHSKSTLA